MQAAFDFNERPFLVIWETTHACDLACQHCRAQAEPEPAAHELSTDEAKKLIDDVAAMRTPILVFSGGDPLKRPDIVTLVRYAKERGIRTGVIPAATPLLTHERIRELRDAGLSQIAFSLDAATAAEHDAFRRVEGVFERTLDAVRYANLIGLPVQINSLVNVHNTEKLDELIALIETLNIVFWEVFFLVPMGRGKDLQLPSAAAFDAVFEKLYALSKRAPFVLKITEAPHFRQFVHRRNASARLAGTVQMPEELRKRTGPGGTIGHAPEGVNAGKGFAFVSCEGDVYPSGFLPITAGNVRYESLPAIYRDSALFQILRDVTQLKGRCRVCEYASICGGSRSRAFALTGDYLAEDPCCSYDPLLKTA